MTPDEIMSHAERLRAEKVGMTNYTRIINDAFVLIRELASNQKVRDQNIDAAEPKSPVPDYPKDA